MVEITPPKAFQKLGPPGTNFSKVTFLTFSNFSRSSESYFWELKQWQKQLFWAKMGFVTRPKSRKAKICRKAANLQAMLQNAGVVAQKHFVSRRPSFWDPCPEKMDPRAFFSSGSMCQKKTLFEQKAFIPGTMQIDHWPQNSPSSFLANALQRSPKFARTRQIRVRAPIFECGREKNEEGSAKSQPLPKKTASGFVKMRRGVKK